MSRVSAAVLAAGLSLAGPQAVGVAFADADGADSAATESDAKPGRRGGDSASAPDHSAASEKERGGDQPEVIHFPPPRTDLADPSDGVDADLKTKTVEPEGDAPEVTSDLGEPADEVTDGGIPFTSGSGEVTAFTGSVGLEGETQTPLVTVPEDGSDSVVGDEDGSDSVENENGNENEGGDQDGSDSVVKDQDQDQDEVEDEDGSDSAVKDDVDPDSRTDSGEDASGGDTDVTDGRGGGVTPLPYWRGAGEGGEGSVDDPEVLPVIADGDLDVPVEYAEGTKPPVLPTPDADPSDKPDQMVVTQDGAEIPDEEGDSGSQEPPGKLVAAVVPMVNRILDSVSNWLETLPAGPFQEFLAGVLLQIRNALPQRIVQDGSEDPVPALPVPDVPDDFLDGLTGLSETDAAAMAAGQGLTVRIVARDGERYPVTKDYRTDRLNLDITNGVVVRATIG